MRELDELLLGYLEHRYDSAAADEKAAFRELLALSDPELMAYLLYNEQPAARIEVVVSAILDRARS